MPSSEGSKGRGSGQRSPSNPPGNTSSSNAFAALFAVLLRDSLTGAVVGLLMAYVAQLTTQLNMMVRMLTMVEGSFNAVERIIEYIDAPQERALEPDQPTKPDTSRDEEFSVPATHRTTSSAARALNASNNACEPASRSEAQSPRTAWLA